MVEPNPHLYARLAEQADGATQDMDARLSFPINTINAFFPTDTLPPGKQYDAVVFTLVLCSVQDLHKTIEQARKLLKPGGRLVFLEHVCPPKYSAKYFAARVIGPLWTSFGDGCELTRETEAAIRAFDWDAVELDRFDKTLPNHGMSLEWLANHIIMGKATK